MLVVMSVSLIAHPAKAQCSICARTAQQLGDKPAKSLNAGIIYLMAVPFTIIGIIGYRWWRNEYGRSEE